MSRVNVKIDANSFDLLAEMSPVLNNAIKKAVSDSLENIYDKWTSVAKERLNTTAEDYISGLSISVSNDGLSGSIKLEGSFQEKIELGSSPFDLKVGFSQSSLVKASKKTGNWYLDIPFRHGTPNSKLTYSKLPYRIYNSAKKIPNLGKLSVNEPALTSWTGYQHTTSIYDDLKKISIKSGKRNMYMTWRRVSEKSDPLSWVHPGFKGVNLLQDITPFASQILEETVRNYIHEVFEV